MSATHSGCRSLLVVEAETLAIEEQRADVEPVPEVGYRNSCTLDRSLRSDVCNSYFCGGLLAYLTGDEVVIPTMVIAGAG
jgi:hypothetical protein